MICNNCLLKSICKINEMVNNHPNILIDVKNCEYVNFNKSESNVIQNNINITDDNNQVRESRATNDVTELSNRLRAEEEAKKKGVQFVETSESDLQECLNCNDKVFYTFNCSKCNRQICTSCASVDLSDPSVHLCGDCDTINLDEELTEDLTMEVI